MDDRPESSSNSADCDSAAERRGNGTGSRQFALGISHRKAEMVPGQKTIVRICLYTAISSTEQNRPKRFSPWQRIKRKIARGLDIAAWFLLKLPRVHFYHWESVWNTNKGDIAIRETLKAQLRKAFAPADVHFDELKWGQLKVHMAAEMNRSCDLLVIGGSGYIRPMHNRELPKDVLEDAKVFGMLDCPVVAYGIGWNCLLDKDGPPVDPLTPTGYEQLKEVLKTIDLISVRDRATQELVREVSGRAPSLVGDPALFYADLFAGSVQRSTGKSLQVGLNMAIHGPESAKRIEQEFDSYCAFLKAFTREHSATFHYVHHAQTECVIPLMLASRGISVQSHDLPAEKLIDFYRTLDIHICQMMHSSVLSLGALVPTMNFGYDIKNRGLFELMGLEEFYFSSWNFDEKAALKAAGRLIGERDRLVAQIAARKKELGEELDKFLRSVVELTTLRTAGELRNHADSR